MAKLVKQKYTNAKGERKTYSYLVPISKSVVKASGIEEDDEIVVYAFYDEIRIQKKYHCTCEECGYEWESGKAYDVCTTCPRCKVGDIHYDINGGYNDNQKQRIEKDA